LQTSGVERARIATSGNIGIGTATPTTALEVSGTVSATNFIGNDSGLTGVAASTDRAVSSGINVIAEQTSGTVRVSRTLALANTGNEVCDSKTWYSFRVNPCTGQMQMCRPQSLGGRLACRDEFCRVAAAHRSEIFLALCVEPQHGRGREIGRAMQIKVSAICWES
jgi:hypothetical protein